MRVGRNCYLVTACLLGTTRLLGTPEYSLRNWPIAYRSRPIIAKLFQLNSNESEMGQGINLEFSAFVHRMSGLNWTKRFSHCSVSGTSSTKKNQNPRATMVVNKFFWKTNKQNLGWLSRHNWCNQGRQGCKKRQLKKELRWGHLWMSPCNKIFISISNVFDTFTLV